MFLINNNCSNLMDNLAGKPKMVLALTYFFILKITFLVNKLEYDLNA